MHVESMDTNGIRLERGLADAALALCGQGKLVPFTQATHWLHHEEPEAVNRELLKALAA